ncbi:MAG: hypothetical protein KME49_14515 [Brasilonema octagenarum HA4186-MV1]|jgi:hypothetical protein|uniref:Uncharacterized protein n=2 Tax=Brasilonema TaxID=383614 RepID=A0A856M929_9CYAN|nr:MULTISPECIES: hypothetical protein [Brasilonema]MBW4626670.1 hypothetical protein [Brasilonema octagenarum HA4186-MV1]NMF63706.1 hypothetical protein [Brasilonema octagenarum UFV-OR1]QDL07673.1 hypothetical protein DP114_06975 [Brasilonema sennae CENA114]QDL14035.1 hypothetical protein DP113_06935 [Brasilonema octagenarum UFV-E1]
MIISDLNLLETVEGAEIVGGIGLTKNVNLTTGSTQNFNVNIALLANKSITSSLTSTVNAVGNSSINIYDNTASGNNSYTESNVTNTVIAGVGSESAGVLTAGARL